MPRFFVDPQQLLGPQLRLEGENAAHARVLRLKPGEFVTVCDGQGTDCLCVVTQAAPDLLELEIRSRERARAEPRVECSIYMAFPKADKFEHVIQKATELGAGEMLCYPSARCVSRPDGKSLAKKLERWQRIAASAAEQSGRGRIPRVLALDSYAQALERAARAELAVCFYENEQAHSFRRAIEAAPFASAALLSGPEGGFEEAEIRQAAAAGLQICTLGSRILRCETAPLCALSALMYAAGEF